MQNILTYTILDKYLKVVLNSFFEKVRFTNLYYNFRCNVCGDSKKTKKKKRGYILKQKHPWVFKCHNCDVSMSAERWLKRYFPVYHTQYIQELLQSGVIAPKENTKPNFKKTIEKVKEIREKHTSDELEEEKIETSWFRPINLGHGELYERARALCVNRKIPELVWKNWFVSINGKYRNRMIIPFFDDKQNIYYYQARALYNWLQPKYINRVSDKKDALYNYYNIDRSKPVILTEGIIDSLFIENAVAVCGTAITEDTEEQLKGLDVYYLFDCDKPGRKKSQKHLLAGKNIFLWKKFLEDHGMPQRDKWDVNDVYLYLSREKPFDFSELKRYFSNELFDEVYT